METEAGFWTVFGVRDSGGFGVGRSNLAVVRRQLGFTLMELLVVLGILALVLTAGWLAAKTQIAKAHDARRKEDLMQLQQALEHYYSDFGRYPVKTVLHQCGGQDLEPYLKKIPCDPGSKQAYVYLVGAGGQRYELYANLNWKQDPLVATVGCQTGCGPNEAYNYGVASAGINLGQLGPEEVGGGGGTGGQGEGQAQCGTEGNWFCFANVCAECCPGEKYRCNATGTKCILDETCVR